MDDKKKKIAYEIIAVLISVLLLLSYFFFYRSVPRLLLLVVLSAITLILPKAFSAASFLRCLIIEAAFLPYSSLGISLSLLKPSVPSFKDFFQTIIAFSFVPAVFVPVIVILLAACSHLKKEIKLKRYIPFAVLILLSFAIAIFFPAIINHAIFASICLATLIVTDLVEGKLMKKRNPSWESLIYVLLIIKYLYGVLI